MRFRIQHGAFHFFIRQGTDDAAAMTDVLPGQVNFSQGMRHAIIPAKVIDDVMGLERLYEPGRTILISRRAGLLPPGEETV